MVKQLVLIGGGHAHMLTLDRLGEFIRKGYSVTVIQPSDYHYYSGMGPGMLGGTYQAADIRFVTRRQVEQSGARFVKDKVVRIDPLQQRLILEISDEEISYDVLSCNVGSHVPQNQLFSPSPSVFGAKPIENLSYARKAILAQLQLGDITVAVVGGGPSAAEIAGNVHQLCNDNGRSIRILLFAGREFLSGRSPKVKKYAREILERKGVEIFEGVRAERVEDDRVIVAGGANYKADITFCAVGVRPSTLFSDSGFSVGRSGGLSVNKFLQSTEYPNIFGGGDCIDFLDEPLDKVGVYAVRQNPTLFNNLMAALEETPFQSFEPGGAYLLIYNLGGRDGVLSKWSATVAGSAAFRVKDYIDRKFMRTYQN